MVLSARMPQTQWHLENWRTVIGTARDSTLNVSRVAQTIGFIDIPNAM